MEGKDGKQNIDSDSDPARHSLSSENDMPNALPSSEVNLKVSQTNERKEIQDSADLPPNDDQSRGIQIGKNVSAPLNSDERLKRSNSTRKETVNLCNETINYNSGISSKALEEKYAHDEADEDTVCGIGSFRPAWMQKWATQRVFLILFSIQGVLQGSNFSYFSGILTTLEKRYAFNSKTSGVIMMIDELSPLFFGVIIGYFGGRGHRPRLVALGMLMAISCSFISTLPYFIYGPAEHLTSISLKNKADEYELCDDKLKDGCEEEELPAKMVVVSLFLLAGFLKGFGSIAYHTIGIAYLDDNTNKKSTPLYFGFTLAFRLLGPLLGFLVSSTFLKYYENPFDDPGYGPEDPRWIGGWWMGYLLLGTLLTIVTIPVALFPRRLPSQPKPKSNDESPEKMNICLRVPGLFTALKRLAKNPLFFFMVVNTIMMIYGTVGHYTMLPKYMENQFRLSASDANLFSGPPGLVAVMISIVFGGFLIWKYKPTVKIMIAGMVFIEAVGVAGYLLLMIPSCGNINMPHFGKNDEGLILESSCNRKCGCSTSAYTPVCGTDGGTSYFSACFAGCTRKEHLFFPDEKQVFENCSCLSNLGAEHSSIVTEGYCIVENCWSQALIYIVTWPVFQAIRSVLAVANTMILLRSVHPSDKSLALGTFEALVCPLGYMPFAVIFGAVVDSACVVWEKNCGQTGNCWVYDLDKFSYLSHGISAFFSTLSAVSFLAIYYFRNRVRNLYEDEDDEIDSEEKTTESEKMSTVTAL